jgi:hypothetical protein
VVKSGRTLTIAQTDVFSESGGQEKLIALLTATLMAMEGGKALAIKGEPVLLFHSSSRLCGNGVGGKGSVD